MMIASRNPFLSIDHVYAGEAIGPARRQEAEIDVPRLRHLELVTISRVRLLPLFDVVKRVMGADEPKICECLD
jgi:hypothetical protein